MRKPWHDLVAKALINPESEGSIALIIEHRQAHLDGDTVSTDTRIYKALATNKCIKNGFAAASKIWPKAK